MENDKLIIEPPYELRFVGPFTRPVVTVMVLENPTNNPILFKIKTTAPKRYCVRPNFGVVSPHSQSNVEICLQPFVYDANEKNKHKFMVQSLIAPETDGEIVDYNKIWKEADPSQLMDAKLKCVFELTSTAAYTANSAEGSAAAPEVKSFADNVKFSPKPAGEEKISNLQTSDPSESLMTELRQLQLAHNNLQKDNLNLKEQIVRLRCSQDTVTDLYTPMIPEKQIPMFYIAISIAAAIFGILLGKYLL